MSNVKLERLSGLDCLRGICAVIVLLFHYTVDYSQKFGWANGDQSVFQVPLGSMGVRIFFVISGFVILMTLERSISLVQFAKSRISRLYPAYMSAILITSLCIFYLQYNPRDVGFDDIPFNFIFSAPLFGKNYVDAPYWTLTHEVFFYAFIGPLFYFCKKQRIVMIIFTWLVLSSLWNVFGADEHYFDHFTARSIISVVFNTQYAYLFSLGMLLYLIYKGECEFFLIVTFLLSLGAAGLAEWPTNGHTWSLSQSFKALGYSVIVFAFVKAAVDVFSPKVLIYIGQCSYSIYLIHETIGYFVISKSQSEFNLSPLLSILVATWVVIMISSFMRKYIEVPGQLFIKSIWRKL